MFFAKLAIVYPKYAFTWDSANFQVWDSFVKDLTFSSICFSTYIHSGVCHTTHEHTHNRLTALCSRLPRWAGARRNIHPLTSITSSICYDPQHPHSSHHTHTHTFNGPLSGTTRVSQHQKGKPIWILLEQETVSGSGIRWAICKSAPRSKQKKPRQHSTTQFFTGRMPFLPPNQQCQSTEGISVFTSLN